MTTKNRAPLIGIWRDGELMGVQGQDPDEWKLISTAPRTRTAFFRPVGRVGGASVGAGTGVGRICDVAFAIPGRPIAVQVVFANMNTAATLTLNAAKIASPSALMTTQGAALFAAGKALTFGGSASVVLPVAVQGSSRVLPGLVVADPVGIVPVARTDEVGAPGVYRIRAHVPDNSVLLNAGPGTDGAAYNANSVNGGAKLAAYSFASAAAGIDTNDSSLLDFGGPVAVYGLIVTYAHDVDDMVVGGDSLDQGVNTPGSYCGWPVQLQTALLATGRPMNVFNVSDAGMRLVDSLRQLRFACALRKPRFAALHLWSNNIEAFTTAQRDQEHAELHFTLDWLVQRGITPVVLSTGPFATEATKSLNARLADLSDYVVTVDLASLYDSTGALKAEYNDGLADSVHGNLSYHTGVMRLVREALGR
ncbi:MAG: hypothetical protein WAQ08_05885 [Aquabacterium sp.]|uniref:hypothetical protein n=1 Tax=Aquabacterium sp. TaxID=1872578 RepID=UPI003BAF4E6A